MACLLSAPCCEVERAPGRDVFQMLERAVDAHAVTATSASADPVEFVDRVGRHPDVGSGDILRSEEHTSELQSQSNLVCRLLLEKKKQSRPAQNSTTSYATLLYLIPLPDRARWLFHITSPLNHLTTTLSFVRWTHQRCTSARSVH